jgi:hypothetical protein
VISETTETRSVDGNYCGFERKLSRKAVRGERRRVVNENRVISNKYHAVAGQSAVAEASEKPRRHAVMAAPRLTQFEAAGTYHPATKPSDMLSMLRKNAAAGAKPRDSQRNPIDFKYL